MKCSHCPIKEQCRGEEIARLCDLVDPRHRDYKPGYASILAQDDVIVDSTPRITDIPTPSTPRKGCCGDNPYG
jgi:hypothetical protein